MVPRCRSSRALGVDTILTGRIVQDGSTLYVTDVGLQRGIAARVSRRVDMREDRRPGEDVVPRTTAPGVVLDPNQAGPENLSSDF